MPETDSDYSHSGLGEDGLGELDEAKDPGLVFGGAVFFLKVEKIS